MTDITSLLISIVGIILALYSNLYIWKTQILYVKRHNRAEKNLMSVAYANAFLLLTFLMKLFTVFYSNPILQRTADVFLLGSVMFMMLLTYSLKNTLYKSLKAMA
ncbi:MAG: hypothetical protein V1839_01305 [archaeon]